MRSDRSAPELYPLASNRQPAPDFGACWGPLNRFVVVVSPESVIESAAEATADACALARLQASRHALLARVPAWLDMSSQRFRFGENSDAGTRASVSYVGDGLGGI